MKRILFSGYGASVVGVVILGGVLATIVASRVPTTARKVRPINRHAVGELASHRTGEAPPGERDREAVSEQERYDNRADPAAHISPARRGEGRGAFDDVSRRG